MKDDLLTVLPFWSTRAKSGAVSPTATFRAEEETRELAAGAKAAAPVTRRDPIASFIIGAYKKVGELWLVAPILRFIFERIGGRREPLTHQFTH